MLVAVLALAAAPATGSIPTSGRACFYGCALITLVGAVDDRFDLHPAAKLVGQAIAAAIVVHFGIQVASITLPFFGVLHFPNTGATNAGPILTVSHSSR